MPVHGIDNGNNKKDVYTTEEVLSILQQAIDSGTLQGIDPDETPIVAAVRESHNNSDVTFWSGTEAEFNELTGVTSELVGARIGSDGKLYLLTGDTTLSDTVEAARQAALEATEGMKREVISVTLLANGWSNSAPYTQTVAVAGMTADKDFLAPYIEPTGNESADIAAQVALSCISGGTTDTDSVTFYCYEEKPTTTITVYMVDKGTKIEPGDYPIASTSALGMVKVGDGLNVDQAGELSVAAYQIATYSFDNVAAMVAYNLAEGDTAITAGYYSANDGGAGTYKIVSSGATADGGSIIALNNGLKAQLIVENNTINVKQFGAKGDGTTNDTIAIQNALKYNGNNPTTIEFDGKGVYLISSGASIYSNTTVKMNGAKIKTSANIAFMNTKESAALAGYGSISNFKIQNGTFEGETGHGIHFNIFHGLDCRFENIKFNNCFVDTHVFDLGGCKNILIKDCEFVGNLMTSADASNNYREVIQPDYASHGGFPAWDDDGSVAYDGLPTTGLTVDGCIFKKNNDDLYYLNAIGTHATSGEQPHSDILIQNCEFYGAQKANIRLPYFENVKILNNKFFGLNTSRSSGSNSAIDLNSVSGQTVKCSNMLIDGNYYESVNGDDQVFISVLANSSLPAENIVISGMDYRGWSTDSSNQGQDFCDLANVKRVTIKNNIIQNAKQIVFKTPTGTIEGLTIENNDLIDCLRFARCATDATVYNISKFLNSNNNIVNGVNSYNTSSFNNRIGFTQDYAFESSSSSDIKLEVDESDFLTINSNFTVAIPAFLSKFKAGGYLTITPSSDDLIRLRLRVWDSVTNGYVADRMAWAQVAADKKCSIQLPEVVIDNKDMRSSATTNPLASRYSLTVVVSYSHNMTIHASGTDINVSGL